MLGEQIILERANALPTPTLVIRVAAHQSSDNIVSSLHASMSGPWDSLQGDGVRQTPASATTFFTVQYMSLHRTQIAIQLMCRHTCEAALTGP